MNACPGEDDLRRYLGGDLDREQGARVSGHANGCPGCRERLELLARGRVARGEDTALGTIDADWHRTLDPSATEVGDPGTVLGRTYDGRTTEPGGSGFGMGGPGPDPRSTEPLFVPSPPGGETTQDATLGGATMERDPGCTDPLIWADQEPSGYRRVVEPAQWPVIGGYDILQRLGEGGMGVVYKARHRGLNRLVALKMIRDGSQARADHFLRFRVEAESVARLHHPNIIQIYDIGEAGGLPFVALEVLEGGSMEQRLEGNPQPGREAAGLLMTLARAVQVAHEAGIIHRDLKPTNVLYTVEGVPKITDFGLAKRVDSEVGQTQSGQIMGSPCYMSPEQARGHSSKVGPAADVYALGAILYEVLTGRQPFKGETVMETVRQVVEDDPVTPSRLVPRVPRDLETICLKCLEKDPARRYASAGALADDLGRYIHGEPIAGRRIAGWERAARWSRRHPASAVSMSLAVLLLVAAVAGLFAVQESRLERSRGIAAVLSDGSSLEREVDAAGSPTEWRAVQLRISGFLPQFKGLADDPRVRDLRGRLERKFAAVGSRIDEYNSRQSEKERLAAERHQLEDFRRRRNEAIYHDTQFTGLEAPGNQDATRRSAVAALELYAAPGSGDSWALGDLPASFSAADRAEISEGCYELLLVLSQAEPTAEQGLRRLEQAARLHPAPSRAYSFRRAACLERCGDRAGAERERLAAEARPVATALEHYLAGREHYRRNEPTPAIREFYDALRQRPDHFWARCLSAICWLRVHRAEAAWAGFTACLEREPDSAWLYILRGFASSISPEGSTPEEKQIRTRAAEADYRRSLELLGRKPNDELRHVVLVNLGVLRLQAGDLDGADGFLQRAIEVDARPYPAYAALAAVRRDQGRTEEAMAQFGLAIERQPGLAALYRDRAGVVLADKSSTPAHRAQALADLDRSIRLEKPDDPILVRDHTDRGRLLALDGRSDEALAAYDAAIERSRDHEDAHRLRLDLLLRLKRHDDVIRSCDPLIARGKASAAIYQRRALAREATREFSGAIEDFTSAMARGGDRARLLRRRGWLYIVADAPGLALHDFEEAIRLDPSSGDAHNGRGHSRLRLGEHREAVADVEQALSIGQPTADLFYKAARVYALAGVVVAAEARKKGREVVGQVIRYQDRAAGLLREAIRRRPVEDRASFFKDVILADPDLRTLRRRVAATDLAGPLPASTSPGAGQAH